jgi:primary-amine oxidase
VVWFNLGMHHVPHTGDLPNTVFTTAQAGIAISPHNYLLGDPSRQTSHSVYIDTSGEEAKENMYGGQQAVCAYDMAKLHPDLSSYPKSETVRKWPDVYVGGGS